MTAWLCTGGSAFATKAGPVAVERLAPGDTLLAEDGTALAVAWVGRQHLPAAALAARPGLWPIHVASGAAHTVLPAQPLAFPGHPPVAARWLVDGVALSRPAPTAPLDIYTLLLDGPAPPAGAPCLADGTPEPPRPDDATLFAIRRHLAATRTPGPLAGTLDAVARHLVEGWVAEEGTGPVAIELVLNGIAHPPLLADIPRPDLQAAGIGDGRRGFRIALDPPLDPRRHHLLRLRRALDGADLPGSPALLDAAPAFAALPGRIDDAPALREAAQALAARLETAAP